MVPVDTSCYLYSIQRCRFKQVSLEHGSKKKRFKRSAMQGGMEQGKAVPDYANYGSGREAKNREELVSTRFCAIA
jgi:hypothetical protein